MSTSISRRGFRAAEPAARADHPERGDVPHAHGHAIDTSAADFTCCPLAEGELDAAAALGAPLITGELKNVKASGCRTSASISALATDELFIASQGDHVHEGGRDAEQV